MQAMKDYAIYLLSGIFSVLLLVAAVNWLVNPYDIFHSPEISGLNAYKSEVERHTRLSKVYQLERIKPEVILLASSRGLVVPDSYLGADGMKAYNLSLPSASSYELFRMLQHAQSVQPLKRVVLALDEQITGSKQANFIENRLAVNADGTKNADRWKQTWHDYFSSLLSIDALRASSRTVRKQKESPLDVDAEDYDKQRVFRAGGHHQMFRTMEASIFSQYKGDASRCDMSTAKVSDSKPVSLNIIEQIVDFAYKNDIELFIYFSPVHARFYEAKCMVGQWPEIEQTKRMVVETTANMARRYGMKPFPVWDFAGYNDITTEKLPEAGDRASQMKWYWEGSHYSRRTARKIFDQLFTAKDGYGILLTADNIEIHLRDIRQQRERYVTSHGDDISELTSLFEKSRSAH